MWANGSLVPVLVRPRGQHGLQQVLRSAQPPFESVDVLVPLPPGPLGRAAAGFLLPGPGEVQLRAADMEPVQLLLEDQPFVPDLP
ncbi:hypothetical protein C0Q61_24440 [Streptomyces albidoflavus]|nr:hypothetical protein C0Q61_24440 [Streptomyces albidoflavus]